MTADSESGAAGEAVDRRVLHRGRRFTLESLTERSPDGTVVEKEIVRHPGAVVIVPILGDSIVMIRNQRVAVGETLLELPAGTLEASEGPAVCAARELVEETGYEAATVESLGWFYTTPGLTDERMHAFVARDLHHVGQRLEAGERITVECVPVAGTGGGAGKAGGGGVFELIDDGALIDAKSIVALLLASRRGYLPGASEA